MFFVLAGITPKTVTLDDAIKTCPLCGRFEARYKRVDHYFNLFFIPLFRVKKGSPVLMCDLCQKSVDDFGADIPKNNCGPVQKCYHCHRPISQEYTFCPFCGRKVA